MLTCRYLRLIVFPLAGALLSAVDGSPQGLDTLLQFANAGKAKTATPVSTMRDGERVSVGATAADGSVGVAADAVPVPAGTRTAIYRDCEDEILLVPAGNHAEDVRKDNCDYERVGMFPWGQPETVPVELNVALATPTLGALQVAVEEDGRPVLGARVAIAHDGMIVTDRGVGATGMSVLTLEPRTYTAVITASGRTARGDVTVEAGAVTSVTAEPSRGRFEPNETPFGQYRPMPTSRAERGHAVSVADLKGLLSVRVDSPIGATFLAFPAAAGAGETVSWSVITVPAGSSQGQIEENRAQLSRQVITIDGQRYALSDASRWTMTAQPQLSVGVGDDRPRVEFQLSFNQQPSRPIPEDEDAPIPARAGWPVRIPGSFDGRFDTTTISVGDESLDVVAESSRALYFNPPAGPTGVQQVVIGEQGESHQVPIRNIGLDLSVDEKQLWRGQSTPLHVRASGLAGITSPAFMVLINRTTSIISMTQGDAQFWLIHPRDVGADGQATYERAVRGIQRGPFIVDGILMVF